MFLLLHNDALPHLLLLFLKLFDLPKVIIRLILQNLDLFRVVPEARVRISIPSYCGFGIVLGAG
jgi:hypothetical protein